MNKNKVENTNIIYLVLLCLSKKSLRCDKVQKSKMHFPNVFTT